MAITPMTPLPSAQSELVEEALSEIFELHEQSLNKRTEIEPVVDKQTQPKIIEELITKRLVEDRGGNVVFTTEGARVAEHVIRRKRLAERLMKDVLNLSEEVIDPAACQWEHILSKE